MSGFQLYSTWFLKIARTKLEELRGIFDENITKILFLNEKLRFETIRLYSFAINPHKIPEAKVF